MQHLTYFHFLVFISFCFQNVSMHSEYVIVEAIKSIEIRLITDFIYNPECLKLMKNVSFKLPIYLILRSLKHYHRIYAVSNFKNLFIYITYIFKVYFRYKIQTSS